MCHSSMGTDQLEWESPAAEATPATPRQGLWGKGPGTFAACL